jgi:hypothetical protein
MERKESKGQRHHQELFSVNRVGQRLSGEERKKVKVNTTIKNSTVRTVSGGGCKERKESPPARQRRPSRPRTIQCEPCQAAAGWRGKKVKVNATIKNYSV